MKVTYIHHSSFLVEYNEYILLFDYFRWEKGKLPELDEKKKIYVFASHKHQDHFDIKILELAEKYPNIQYILSKDIRLSVEYLKRHNINPKIKEKISYMKANEVLSKDELIIETLLSTDAGVAFCITLKDKTIFHAGDLHWWHWEGEDESFHKYQEETYKSQIALLKEKNIFLAFVVLDGRLKEQKFWGIDYFLEHVNATNVIPMHLWNEYSLILEYKESRKTKIKVDHILPVTKENEVFEL